MPRIDDRKILALMIGVVGIVLLLVSFILPWWGLNIEIEGTTSGGGFGASISSGISFQGSGTSFYIGGVTKVVYIVAAILIILALICASLMVTSLMISLVHNNKIIPSLSRQFGVLALVFCLLAPIMFMITLPMAMRSDAEREADDNYEEPDRDDPTKSFFGSYEEEGSSFFGARTTKSNWGGDIGWILSFVSSLFLAISVILTRPRKEAPISPQVQPIIFESPETPLPHPIRYGSPPPPPPPSI
jgi:hypothetical protein